MIETNPRIISLQKKLAQARGELNEALAEVSRGDVKDYIFGTPKGPVTLSSLFGNKRDLFVMHSMGVSCPNCTMFADGFNGVYPHLSDRAAFVVSSPDSPAVQAAFAASRGWRFTMVSCEANAFAADMGFMTPQGRARPGLSAFRMDAGRIVRVSATNLQRNDDLCPSWLMLDLLPEGADGWYPKLEYG